MSTSHRHAKRGSALALTTLLVVSGFRMQASTPVAKAAADEFRKRRPFRLAEIRQRMRDFQGGVLTEAEVREQVRQRRQRRAAGKSPFHQSAARKASSEKAPFTAAGFHADGLDVPELTPLNPLFDPLAIFEDETGEEPPVGPTARLFLADFDGDGDLDAFVGDKYGYVRYLENVADPGEEPVYEERTGTDSPTGALDLSEDGDGSFPYGPSAPTLVDVDGDEDLDLFVGQGYGLSGSNGRVLFFENDGSGNLTRNDADNPLDGFAFGVGGATPHFVDIDEDGDFDAFVGTKFDPVLDDGEVFYLENQGDDENPSFVDQTEVPGVDPFTGVVFEPFTAPFFADVDGDGDEDAFVGNYYQVRFFDNQSAMTMPTVPVLVEQTGYDNPLFGAPCLLVAPSFGDVDGDGDLDAFVTGGYYKSSYGFVHYLENTGDSTDPAFLAAGDRIELVDVDGDGDLDALVSYPQYILGDDAPPELFLEVRYFENTGTPAEPVWTLRSGLDNPFFTFNTTYGSVGYSYEFPSAAPTVGHLDGDAFLDAFIGLPDGTLEFLEGDGTGQLDPAAPHPLEAEDFGADPDPQLVDVNGDGELDLVVGHNRYDEVAGEYYPTVSFFVNPTGPAGLAAPADLVLDLTSAEIQRPAPFLADVDGDGDLDLYVGGSYYDDYFYPLTLFLENTAATEGGLEFDVASADLVEAYVGQPNSPTLGDVNGDGVLDLAIGNFCGPEFFLSAVPVLEVTKQVTGGDQVAGGTVEYTITVENTGSATAQDLAGDELTDTLPAELSLTGAMVTSGPGAASADPGTNTVSYDGTLAPGEVVTILVTADVDAGAAGQVVSNQAFANFDTDGDLTADTQEPSDDPATVEDDDPTDFTVLAAPVFPQLEVTKAVTGGSLEEGGTVEYTLTIDNVGAGDQPDDPANPELTDTLPPELTVLSAMVTSGPGAAVIDPLANSVRYDGAIPAGGTVTLVIEAMIEGGTEGMTVANQAVASFDSDGDGTNDTQEPSDDPATPAADDDSTLFAVAAAAVPIPTLSQWASMLFGAFLSLLGFFAIRRTG